MGKEPLTVEFGQTGIITLVKVQGHRKKTM